MNTAILQNIFSHLNNRDKVCCLGVCTLWFKTCAPMIWKQTTGNAVMAVSDTPRLTFYCQLVHRLEFVGIPGVTVADVIQLISHMPNVDHIYIEHLVNVERSSINTDNITKLRTVKSLNIHDHIQSYDLKLLVELMPMINELVITELSSDKIYSIAKSVPYLERLYIEKVDNNKTDADFTPLVLLSMCCRRLVEIHYGVGHFYLEDPQYHSTENEEEEVLFPCVTIFTATFTSPNKQALQKFLTHHFPNINSISTE